ncbi:hypothetical protein [Streptococcus dysgalactiae]|uniref:hypothetical protein n=1 Tax=Streptococcus dysgalactiae TaxID=1334 RepID=UPI0019529F41|nr:hypothetical protein [Streptococcus dysgalactiae]
MKTALEGGFIDEITFRSLKPTGSTTPQLYGLPKTHKAGIPLRPILSMTNSAQHKLAKWLAKLLKPVRDNVAKYNLKDSFDLAKSLQDMNIGQQVMGSLDIESLFTNVPLRETIAYVLQCIEELKINVGLPASELERLLLICTENISFEFQSKTYRQSPDT